MHDFSIRPAGTHDLEGMVNLISLLFAIEEDFEADARLQRRGLELLLSHTQAIVLIAEAGSTVIGMSTGQITISTAEGGPALLVEDVVVQDTWRGKGVGRQLMAGLEQWACQQGIGRLQLLADTNNVKGLEFYRAQEWEITQLICLRKRPKGTSIVHRT